MIDPIDRDLARHLDGLDRWEARQDALSQLIEDDGLTEAEAARYLDKQAADAATYWLD